MLPVTPLPPPFFAKRNFLQRDTRFKKHNRPCDVIPHLRYHFRIHHLKSILTEWTTIVIAVHPFVGRRTQQNIQALLDILLIRHLSLHRFPVSIGGKFQPFPRKPSLSNILFFSLILFILLSSLLDIRRLSCHHVRCCHPYELLVCHLSLQWMNLLLLYPAVPRKRTCHLRRLLVFSLSKHSAHFGPTIGPPTCGIGEGNAGVCMGQVCISVILAAGGIIFKLKVIN